MLPIRYNLRSLMQRRATSLMAILGIALVTTIFVILFGFINGLSRTLLNTSGEENWIILSRGAPDETESFISHDKIDILKVRPEIATDDAGEVLMSPEIFAGVDVSQNKRVKEFALLRGVNPIAYRVHRNMRLVDGHWPIRGRGEWVVGQKLHARHPYLRVGSQFHFGRRNWKIVGTFSDNDSARESEIWTDLEDLRVDARNKTADTNSLHAVLKPGLADSFKDAIKKDGRLPLDSLTEADYYAGQTKIASQLRSIGLVVALALAVGATFGGMNTMYTAVARRKREIGVLRALGFTRSDILSTFMIESALLGLAGGVIGIGLATLAAWATGLTSRLMAVGTIFFSYRLNAVAIAAGLAAAAVIGVAGGLLPSWRATRVNVIDSLRAT
jgi:putative ABC transport system permease protein